MDTPINWLEQETETAISAGIWTNFFFNYTTKYKPNIYFPKYLYTIPLLNEFRIGASISNFGSKMKMDGRDILLIKKVGAGEGNIINTDIQLDEFDLPLIFRIGVGVDVIKDANQRLTAAVDAIHPNDNSESVNTGFEYAWNEMFFARAGYKSLFEEKGEQGLTLGLGINYRIIESVKIMLDYAYQDFGRLKNVQYISLGIRF